MNAFMFVPLLAMTWIFGMLLSMLASRYFLGVMESSAAGHEEVELPGEPFLDWMGKVLYLGFFIVIWSIPSLILVGSVGRSPLLGVVVAIVPFWLLFPIGILSPMSSQARWIPFSPELPARMARRGSATMQFYLLSLPVLLGFGYSFSTVTGASASLAGLALAPVAAALFLIYARLLGRLGLVISFAGAEDPMIDKPKKKKKKRPTIKTEKTVYVQPSQLQGVQTPYDGEVVGYDVDFASDPVPAERPPTKAVESELEPQYGMDEPVADAVVESTNLIDPEQQRRLHEPSKREMDLISAAPIEEPKQPFGASTIQFLAAPQMMSSLLKLSAGIAVIGLLLLAMRALRPE